MSYSLQLGKDENGDYIVLSQTKGVTSPNNIMITGHVHSGTDANDFITITASGLDEKSYVISASAHAPYPRKS